MHERNLAHLPPNVLERIVSYVPTATQKVQLTYLCRAFRLAANSPAAWDNFTTMEHDARLDPCVVMLRFKQVSVWEVIYENMRSFNV